MGPVNRLDLTQGGVGLGPFKGPGKELLKRFPAVRLLCTHS
jgi:hypothetical protein